MLDKITSTVTNHTLLVGLEGDKNCSVKDSNTGNKRYRFFQNFQVLRTYSQLNTSIQGAQHSTYKLCGLAHGDKSRYLFPQLFTFLASRVNGSMKLLPHGKFHEEGHT